MLLMKKTYRNFCKAQYYNQHSWFIWNLCEKCMPVQTSSNEYQVWELFTSYHVLIHIFVKIFHTRFALPRQKNITIKNCALYQIYTSCDSIVVYCTFLVTSNRGPKPLFIAPFFKYTYAPSNVIRMSTNIIKSTVKACDILACLDSAKFCRLKMYLLPYFTWWHSNCSAFLTVTLVLCSQMYRFLMAVSHRNGLPFISIIRFWVR